LPQPDSDKELFERPEVLTILLETVREGMKDAGQGAAWEATNMPLSCAEYLRDTIPNTHATVLPHAGHPFYYKRWGEILAALVD
jgi:hypothetical protein